MTGFLVAILLGLVALAVWGALPRRAAPPEAPLPRRCPVCGAGLEPGENLLAERFGPATGRDGREKIVIKGCPRCLGGGASR